MRWRDLLAMQRSLKSRGRQVGGRAQREQVRALAFSLVPPSIGAGANFDARDIAALILLRALDLQVQVRRAARLRQATAAVILARSSLESAITAAYVLRVPDAADRFNSGSGRDAVRLLSEVAKQVELDMAGPITAELGKLRVPVPSEMVREALAYGAPDVLQQMYVRFYGPLSAMTVHAAPLALMRHVHPRVNRVRRRPYRVWSRRSAVRTADAMVAFVALEFCRPSDDSLLFVENFNGNWGMARPPLLFVIRGLALTHIKLARLHPLVADVRQLRKRIQSGLTLTDNEIDRVIARFSAFVDIDPDEGPLRGLTEQFRQLLRTATWNGNATEEPASGE